MREASDTVGAGKSRWLTRRRLFETALGAAMAIGASVVALARTSGYRVAPTARPAVLMPWQFIVVEHAARRIAAADRPEDASIPSADDVGVAAFVDSAVGRLPDAMRRDLGRFLAYLEHAAPIAVGHASRFTRLASGAQDRVLASIEASSSDLLRAGFQGLRSLVFMGYYRDPRTWAMLGYDGPLVGRPQAGW